jgi:amino-acid N-acetyltransferase
MTSATPPGDIDAQMLQTLELLHYCQRFAGKLFAFVFERSRDCEEMLSDLRVLHAASIRQAIFCAADPGLHAKLELWNRSGHKFLVLEGTLADLRTAAFIGRLQRKLGEGSLPLVALRDFPADERGRLRADDAIMHCAVCLGAVKVFFPGEQAGLSLDGRIRSYPTAGELQDALDAGRPSNVSHERLQFLVAQQRLHAVDMVIVPARRGSIYEEVFTHSGSGTLLTRDYPNVLRPARETDVRDIMAIMQPYIEDGSIKSVSEEALLKSIPSFTVYSVNDQIVAAAALIPHEDCYELAKLCTLPRYQARGRARDLVRALQERTRGDGKRALFALTVQPFVGQFFERVGFVPVQRERLPGSWQKDYDFERPSSAYWYEAMQV